MLTDIIKLSPERSYGKFLTSTDSDRNLGCGLVRTVLTAAGWTLAGWTSATATASFPLGFPDTVGGLDPTNRFALSINNLRFIFFNVAQGDTDPTGYDPIHNIYTIGVQIAATSNATADRLAQAIRDTGVWSVIPTASGALGGGQSDGLALTSLLMGTEGNNFFVDGNGSFSVGSGNSQGGGWILDSKTQQETDISNGITPPSNNTTRTRWTVRAATLGQNAVEIQVEVDGITKVSYPLARATWEVKATSYDALVSTSTPFHSGDIYVLNTYMHSGSLCTPPESAFAKIGFIITGGLSRATVGIGIAGTTIYTNVDGKAATTAWGQDGFSFCFYHYQAGPYNLQTRAGKSVFLPALVMMPCHPPDTSDEPRVVGWMWDCFLDTKYSAVPALIVQEGAPYRAVYAQAGGAVGTVFARWPVKPPEEGEVPTPPPSFTGTCNVFGPGVTRLTGSPFTQDLVGRLLYINNLPLRVLSVADADHLTLDGSAAGIQANVAYHT